MPKQLEARIVITRGRRIDCQAEIGVFDVLNNKFVKIGITAGPREEEITRVVKKIRDDLERAGNVVTYCDRRD